MEISCNIHVSTLEGTFEGADFPLGLSGKYRFEYDYPLERNVSFDHDLSPEMRGIDVLRLASEDYKKMYAEEDAASGDPGRVDGMLNRNKSTGPYGIWGHYIEDLFFEKIFADDASKSITFFIGS